MRIFILIFLSLSHLCAHGLSIQILNDEPYDTDEQLTGSLRLLYVHNDNWSFHIGQDIYTPSDTDTPSPINGDRPYNAWLYIGTTFQYEEEEIETLLSLRFDIGSRGPRAKGEEIQNGLHRIIGARISKGWGSQTDDEYANQLSLTIESVGLENDISRLSAYLTVDSGTLWRNYSLGISAAVGYNAPYYMSQISFPEKSAFYLFGNIQAILVDENRLLEDNSGYNVVKKDFLRKYDVGINWDIEDFRLRVTATTMSKEFITQEQIHRFLLIELSLGF